LFKTTEVTSTGYASVQLLEGVNFDNH